LRAALAHKAEEKIGCELSRLKQAVAKLQEVRRAKPPPCPALEAMSALEALVLVEQNIATKDNQCVYMEPVRSPHNPTHLFFFSPPRSAVRATLAPPVHAAARFTLQPRMSASSQLLPFAQQRNAHVGRPELSSRDLRRLDMISSPYIGERRVHVILLGYGTPCLRSQLTISSLDQIPNPDTLPPLTGHSLVKPLAPGDILDPKGGDKLFQSIVPDSSTKALSKYTDMVLCPRPPCCRPPLSSV